MDAAVGIEFAIDITGVDFDGVEREVKLAGNLLVAQPVSNEMQDFNFALAQGIKQVSGAGWLLW